MTVKKKRENENEKFGVCKRHQKIVGKRRKTVMRHCHAQFTNSTVYLYSYRLVLGCPPESHFLGGFTVFLFFDSAKISS